MDFTIVGELTGGRSSPKDGHPAIESFDEARWWKELAKNEGRSHHSHSKRIPKVGRAWLVRSARRRSQGMEDQTIHRLTARIMSKPGSPSKFVLCVRTGDAEDLDARKVYAVRPDPKAAKEGYLRIVDESGEDYLYPAEYFAAVKLPAFNDSRTGGKFHPGPSACFFPLKPKSKALRTPDAKS